MIHLVGPALLAAALAGTGVYGLIARRNAILVLIGAELILNAANLLLVTAGNLPAGGLATLRTPGTSTGAGTGTSTGAGTGTSTGAMPFDPLLPGQVMTLFVITIAAAEIGLALAVVLLLYRRRATTDLGEVRELGEASATYLVPDDADTWAVVPVVPVVPGVPGASVVPGGDGDGDGGAADPSAGRQGVRR